MTSEQDSSVPSPQTTLIIMLGASKWPSDPDKFHPSDAFLQAAQKMRTYFTESLGIPTKNILWLFNTTLNAIEIGKEISGHLQKFRVTAKDVIVYYVGHGNHGRKYHQLYLAIRATQKENPEDTSLKIESLAETVCKQAGNLRRFYILDCCFAGTAIIGLQGSSETELVRNTFEEVEADTQREREYPDQGYVALFSSRYDRLSIILPDETNTYFTAALFHVLVEDNRHSSSVLSFKEVHNAINRHLKVLYQQYRSYSKEESSRPPEAVIYGANLTYLPIFPNPMSGIQISKPPPRHFLPPLLAVPSFQRRWLLSLSLIVLILSVSISILRFFAFPSITPVSPTTSVPLHKRGTLLLTYGGHTNAVESVAWSPDGKQIATSSLDNTMQVWDAKSGKTQGTYGYGYSPYAIVWLPSGTFLAFMNSNHAIEVRNAVTEQTLFTWTANLTINQTASNFLLSDLTWSPNGKYLAFVSSGNEAQWVALYVLDVAKKNLLFTQSVAQSAATTVVDRIVWSPDSTRIAYTDSTDGNIRVVNATTGQQLSQYNPYDNFNGGVTGLAWSPDGKYLVSGASNGEPSSLDGLVRICNAQTGKVVDTYSGHTTGVAAIAWSPNGKYIASADDIHIQVWDAFTGKNPYIYNKQPGQILNMTWSPDSTRIASVGAGQKYGTGEAMVWQAI